MNRHPTASMRQWAFRTHRRSPIGIGWRLFTQLAIIFVILLAYSWFRKTYFLRPADMAFENALEIIRVQGLFGMAVDDVEIPLQRWALNYPSLIEFFNIYYRQFKPALYFCAALCFVLAPLPFSRIFRVFLLATAIALPWYALYPLAPPRLMGPYGFDFVDTLAVYGGVKSSSSGAGGANQFAAMPSMHIGWTTIAALWLAAAIPKWGIGAIVGSLHVILMCLTVVVTGNHYVLDIVGGFVVAGSALLMERAIRRRQAFTAKSGIDPFGPASG